MKHLIILSIAILSAGPIFAERDAFRDRSGNWLQHENSSATSGSLRGAPTIGTEDPTPTPTTPNAPIGSGVLLLAGLALAYSIGRNRKKTVLLSVLALPGWNANITAQTVTIADFEPDATGNEASYYIIDFDAALPTAQGIVNNAGTAVTSGSAVVEAAPGRTGNALHATFGGYEQNLQMSVTLPQGKILSNYESIELDIYYATSGDNRYKDVKYSINNGTKTKIDATNGDLGVWKALNIPLSASGSNIFTFEIGYNAASGANFYIDNFKMKEKAGTVNPPAPGASVFEDFETKNTGDVYDMKRWYPEDGSATVAADPADAEGKSVHIVTSNWDALLRMNYQLPDGKTLDDYETFSFDIYIGANSSDEYPNYKNMFIYFDDVKKYEESDFPQQAEIATWTTKTFSVEQLGLTGEEKAKTSFTLAFGISTDKGDYYIDNAGLTEKSGSETSIIRPQNPDWSNATGIQVYNINGQRINASFPNKNSHPNGLYIVKAQIDSKPVIQKIWITK